MKIEKINDNKIRCTLTSADLAERNLKLSELAYGTEKARSLFQDMMLEANQQFGFNVDNAPLMVEAVPVAPDSIVLIITRVEDPQELDTRFAKFAPSGDDTDGPEPVQYSGADDIIDLFHKPLRCEEQGTGNRKESGTEGKRKRACSIRGKECGSGTHLPLLNPRRCHQLRKSAEPVFYRQQFPL